MRLLRPVLYGAAEAGGVTGEASDVYWYYYPDSEEERDDDRSCSRCGGEQWTECDDGIQCTYARCDGEEHPCPACRGTGLAKHQVLW